MGNVIGACIFSFLAGFAVNNMWRSFTAPETSWHMWQCGDVTVETRGLKDNSLRLIYYPPWAEKPCERWYEGRLEPKDF